METRAFKIQLDLRARSPLFKQIADQIRAEIVAGKLLPGDPLPAVRDLADQIQVNFNTVARAYRQLDIEGWILTQQGRGTIVSEQDAGLIQQDSREDMLERLVARIHKLVEDAGFEMDDLFPHITPINEPVKLPKTHQPIDDDTKRASIQKKTKTTRLAFKIRKNTNIKRGSIKKNNRRPRFQRGNI